MPQPCAPCPRQALSSLPLSPQAVRPLKNILQGQGSGIKDFIKRNTPTRLHLKVRHVWGGGRRMGCMCWETGVLVLLPNLFIMFFMPFLCRETLL